MLLVSKHIVPALGELKVAEAAQFGASPPATDAAEPEPIAPSNNLLVSTHHQWKPAHSSQPSTPRRLAIPSQGRDRRTLTVLSHSGDDFSACIQRLVVGLNSSARLGVMRRIRTTPMHYASKHLGVTDYTVVNHTMLPKGFGLSVQE